MPDMTVCDVTYLHILLNSAAKQLWTCKMRGRCQRFPSPWLRRYI